jgi:hypothetical protein
LEAGDSVVKKTDKFDAKTAKNERNAKDFRLFF